jgi:uncharacterized protein (UPF0548 family)
VTSPLFCADGRPKNGEYGDDDPVVTPLSARAAAALRAADFTYPEVGATAAALPRGYRHLTRTRALADLDFDAAGRLLLGWQLQERAGLAVAASSPYAEPGAVALMRLGLGRAALRIPCRVVYVLAEPNRVGFAYGSLPGHPESGEELFVLERDDAGRVRLTVTAFSRPATVLARAGGIATRWFQDRVTSRYLRALDDDGRRRHSAR